MVDRNRAKVGEIQDFNEGDRIITEVGGLEVAVFYFDDEYYALLNYCIHQGGPICEGKIEGNHNFSRNDTEWKWEYDPNERIIKCPWHSWKFDMRSGINIDDDSYKIRKFDVEIENGDVFIVM